MELLQHPWNVVARCAMYGIINAGAHATDSLCTLLEEFTVQLAQLEFTTLPTSKQDAIEPSRLLDMITLVSHALGESSQEPDTMGSHAGARPAESFRSTLPRGCLF